MDTNLQFGDKAEGVWRWNRITVHKMGSNKTNSEKNVNKTKEEKLKLE